MLKIQREMIFKALVTKLEENGLINSNLILRSKIMMSDIYINFKFENE